MSQEIWWAGKILHIICLRLFSFSERNFVTRVFLNALPKCSHEIHCPVGICKILIVIFPVWAYSMGDTDRQESEAFLLFCSFSSLISFSGLGLCESAHLCKVAVPALSCWQCQLPARQDSPAFPGTSVVIFYHFPCARSP